MQDIRTLDSFMDSPPPEIQQASSELKDTPQTPLQNLKPSLVTLSDICSPIPFTNEKYTQTFELLFDANHCSINPTFKMIFKLNIF